MSARMIVPGIWRRQRRWWWSWRLRYEDKSSSDMYIYIYIYIIYMRMSITMMIHNVCVRPTQLLILYFMLDLIHDFTWFHTCVCSIFSPDYLNGINSRHGRCAISRFDTYRIQVEKLRHEALRWKQRRKVLKGSLRLDIHTTILWGFPIKWLLNERWPSPI